MIKLKNIHKMYITMLLALGFGYLFGWLLNITPNIDETTHGIDWIAGLNIGWIMAIFANELIKVRKYNKH